MTAGTARITSEEFLDLAEDDKFERWLIRGEMRERPTLPSPVRSGVTAAATAILHTWLVGRPDPRPKLYCGNVYFRIWSNPESNIGIHVALSTPEQAKAVKLYDRLIEGAPLLATEVLSASDTTEDVHEKVREFLDAGTALVWIIDPYDFTVTVYRPGEEPVLYNRNQELIGDPVLPGFRVRVAALFQ